MRLIDADALLEKKQERDCCFTVTEWDILNAPTVCSVKHGKWVADRYCSECEYDKQFRLYDQDVNFCPNCGADMRGDRE